MPKHTPRARMDLLRQEQFELEGQLHDLKRVGISSFSLRRASDLIRQWLTLNKFWRSALSQALGWAAPKKLPHANSRQQPGAPPHRARVQKAPYADAP